MLGCGFKASRVKAAAAQLTAAVCILLCNRTERHRARGPYRFAETASLNDPGAPTCFRTLALSTLKPVRPRSCLWGYHPLRIRVLAASSERQSDKDA